MKPQIDCPVDLVLMNEYRARLVASLVLALGLLYLFTGWYLIIIFLVIDFLARSFNLGAFSVLFIAAGAFITLFNIGNKPTDRAPKRFAARLGLAFNLVILLFIVLRVNYAPAVLASVLCVFAFLESALSICVGCYVYTYWQKLAKQA